MKILKKRGVDEFGVGYGALGILSTDTDGNISPENKKMVAEVLEKLDDLIAQSKMNGGFVLVMAKDGKGNVHSSIALNMLSSAEALACIIDASFKLKGMLAELTSQMGVFSRELGEDDKSIG